YEEMEDQLRKQIRDSFLKEEKLKKFNKLRAYHNQQKNDLQEKINMMAAKMGETASSLEEQQRKLAEMEAKSAAERKAMEEKLKHAESQWKHFENLASKQKKQIEKNELYENKYNQVSLNYAKSLTSTIQTLMGIARICDNVKE